MNIHYLESVHQHCELFSLSLCFCVCFWLNVDDSRLRRILIRHIGDRCQKEAPSRGSRVSFRCPVRRRRPPIEFDARIGRHTDSATATTATQLAADRAGCHRHALALHLEAGARVFAGSATNVRSVVQHLVGMGLGVRSAAAVRRRSVAGAARVAGGDGRQWRAIRVGLKELQFERVELLHEVEVGRDVRFAVAHQREGVVQAERSGVHQVGESDGHRARNAGQTVDEDGTVFGARFLCGRTNRKSWLISFFNIRKTKERFSLSYR